jgi:hypothetical protein
MGDLLRMQVEEDASFRSAMASKDFYLPKKFRILPITQPGSPKKGEPGCLVKSKTRPKTDQFVCSYLTINKLILFKVSKTR